MSDILRAVSRSLGSLTRGRVWFCLLVPAGLAALVMAGLSVFLLDRLAAWLIEQPPLHWLASWGALWLAHLLASLGGWLAILSASYLVAVLFTAMITMPLLLRHLATTDYPDVASRGSSGVLASAVNSVGAAAVFLLGWGLTLPLWWVPGAGLLLSLFWMAWLNRRTFAYDALSDHATPAEWRALRRQHGAALWGIGWIMAVLTHVPWLGVCVPPLAALVYIHYCLQALRQWRAEVSAIPQPVQEMT